MVKSFSFQNLDDAPEVIKIPFQVIARPITSTIQLQTNTVQS